MHRIPLLDLLKIYRETWAAGLFTYAGHSSSEELTTVQNFTEFVQRQRRCFERESESGHVTGSALVVSSCLTQVLLTLHRKLNIWIQLGGHADGESQVHLTALREAEEESGLTDLRFLHDTALLSSAPLQAPLYRALAGQHREPAPFDFDIHPIPAHQDQPAHLHYDVRYLLIADRRQPLHLSDESKDLRWLTITAARRLTGERSMLRQFDKLDYLADLLGKNQSKKNAKSYGLATHDG